MKEVRNLARLEKSMLETIGEARSGMRVLGREREGGGGVESDQQVQDNKQDREVRGEGRGDMFSQTNK